MSFGVVYYYRIVLIGTRHIYNTNNDIVLVMRSQRIDIRRVPIYRVICLTRKRHSFNY